MRKQCLKTHNNGLIWPFLDVYDLTLTFISNNDIVRAEIDGIFHRIFGAGIESFIVLNLLFSNHVKLHICVN